MAVVLLAVGGGIWFFTRPAPVEPTPAPQADPPAEPPGITVSLAAFGTGGRRLLNDAGELAANESVRIRLTLAAPAHVIVGRKDRLGGAHLMYPPKRAGGRAIALPKGGPHELGQPLREVRGDEQLHIYACARSFTWGDVRNLGDRPGCSRVVRALKAP